MHSYSKLVHLLILQTLSTANIYSVQVLPIWSKKQDTKISVTVPCMQNRNLFLTLVQLLRWAGSQTMHHPWIFIHIGVKKEDPHRLVPGHHLPSPPDWRTMLLWQERWWPEWTGFAHTYVPDKDKENGHIAKALKSNEDPFTSCEQELVYNIHSSPIALIRRQAKSHGSNSVHQSPLWVHSTYPSPSKGSYLLPATLYTGRS